MLGGGTGTGGPAGTGGAEGAPGTTWPGRLKPLPPALPNWSRRWMSACTFFSSCLILADALSAALPMLSTPAAVVVVAC